MVQSIYLVQYREHGLVMIVGDKMRRLPDDILSDGCSPVSFFNFESVRNLYEKYSNDGFGDMFRVDKLDKKDIIFQYRILL